MTPLMLLAPLVAVAQETQAEDFRGYIDQAKFSIKKGWWTEARDQLDLAVTHPDGWADPEAWYLLATVRYELSDIEGARNAASRAHTYSRSEEQLQVSAGFSAFVHEQFGIIEVRAPYPGMAARLDIELQTLLFDPEQTQYLEGIQTRYKRKVVLPQRFGLPVGTYLINGVEVPIGPDEPSIVELPASELRTRGPTAAKLAEAEIAVGLSNWLGTDVKNLLPSLNTQVAVSQPIGPARVAVFVDWIPTAYDMVNGEPGDPRHGAAGDPALGWVPLLDRPRSGAGLRQRRRLLHLRYTRRPHRLGGLCGGACPHPAFRALTLPTRQTKDEWGGSGGQRGGGVCLWHPPQRWRSVRPLGRRVATLRSGPRDKDLECHWPSRSSDPLRGLLTR
jgi:hypothetical protein